MSCIRVLICNEIEYDVAEVNKAIKQSAMGILMITFLHFKFGYIQPLLVQSILGFKTFLMTKEARIHFWGSPTTGDLRRPFRIEAPFGMVNEKKQPKTDKGSIKKAEKALKAEQMDISHSCLYIVYQCTTCCILFQQINKKNPLPNAN